MQTGLFSAALAALLAISVLDLRPNSQDTSAIYIANMYHLLANVTTSQPIVLPKPLDPPNFSAPGYAIWVNALWFLSLVMSLTGALLAILIQQWADSYLRATQERQSTQDRVKTREFCVKGLEKSRVSLIVRSVPTLIHVSLFLFFAGLLIWLININHLVCWPVVVWLGLCGIGYAYVTVMPILHHDSPYFSPLSSLIRRSNILTLTQFLFSQLSEVFSNLASSPFGQWLHTPHDTTRDDHRKPLSPSMHEARMQAARSRPLDVNYEAFWWTFKSLKRDSDLEQFFDAIPDLCASQGNALENFIRPRREQLSTALVGLMDRTFSSNLVSESVKLQRIKICMKIADTTKQLLLGHWYFLRRVLLGEWQCFLGSVTFGRFIQNWQNISDSTTNLYIQYVVSAIIATVPTPDGTWPQITRSHRPWIQLVGDHLDMSESILQDHLADMQNVSLANLNCIVSHITRFEPQAVTSSAYDSVLDSLKILESICKLDVQATLPSLQREFCILWNQLVQNHLGQNANDRTRTLAATALRHIHGFHEALHGRTGTLMLAGASPSQYSHCIENGTRTAQSVPTSHTNNATPTVTATHPMTSHSQHDQLSVTSTTAGPLSSTSASSPHGNRLRVTLPSRPTSTSPAPSIRNTAIPVSTPANGGTYNVV